MSSPNGCWWLPSVLMALSCAGDASYETEVRIDPLSELVVPHENAEITDLEAARELRRFLDEHPDRSDAARHVQRLRRFHRERMAAAPGRQAFERALHAIELGRLERHDGRPREAILCWEQAAGLLMADDPLLDELRALAAEAYRALGDSAAALDLAVVSVTDELAGTAQSAALTELRERTTRETTR